MARADRVPVALLWMGGDGGQGALADIGAALERSAAASPAPSLSAVDARTRALLVEGGPATRVRDRLTRGRERFAALRDLAEADGLLAEAEAIALGELPISDACPQLVEIARLRLRYAELGKDEARATHAAGLLRSCLRAPTAEDAAGLSRHAPAPPRPAPSLRVESDPPGATVFLDLQPIGTTPIELTGPRRPGALLDVELAGSRKVHRELAPEAAGTLALSLARDDSLATLVDRIRETPDARPADVAELARRQGATRLLAMRGARDGVVEARLFDAARMAWIKPIVELTVRPLDETALVAYLTATPESAATANAGAAAAGPSSSAATAPTAPVPAWKRWYTWVIGGVLVGGVAAYVIAGNIGDDQITVHVER